MKKQKGYTIVEVLLATVAVAALAAAVIPIVNVNEEQSNAQSIADETVAYSKIYTRYLLNNNKIIRDGLDSSQIIFVPWSTIQNSGYAQIGNVGQRNKFGQTPCLGIMKNSVTNEPLPLLFFVGGKQMPIREADEASNFVGGVSGIYTNNPNDKEVKRNGGGVFGNSGGWFLPNNTAFIQQIQSSCGANPSNNSLVMNISMMSEYSAAIASDQSIHRFRDPDNPTLGDLKNTNTAQTDISFNPNANQNLDSKKIVFSGNGVTGVSLQKLADDGSSDSHVLKLANGTLAANTLQPTTSLYTYTICNQEEVGKMVKQADTNVVIKGQLQCTNNPLMCQGNDPNGQNLSGYCYLPVSDVSVTYHPNTATFACPQGYVDYSVPPVVSPGVAPPNFNGSKWECWASALGVCTNWQYVTRQECSWNNPSAGFNQAGIKSFGNYSISTGITTYTNWQQNSNGYDCNYNGQPSVGQGVIQAVTCTTTAPVLDYHS